MAETERAATIRRIEESIKKRKAEYGVTTGPSVGTTTTPTTPTPVVPKKKKKGTLRTIVEKIKSLLPTVPVPKPKKKIDLPKIAKEDIPALREIMGRPPLKEKK